MLGPSTGRLRARERRPPIWAEGGSRAVAVVLLGAVPSTSAFARAELTPGAAVKTRAAPSTSTGSGVGPVAGSVQPSASTAPDRFGARGRLLFPYGVSSAPVTAGVELTFRPLQALELMVAADTNGLVFGSEAQVNLLLVPLLGGHFALTPYVGGSLQYVRFLPASDGAIDAVYPDWSSLAEDLGREEMRLSDTQLAMTKLEVGLDWVAPSGFNLQLGASRSLQIGDSFGRSTEDGVSFRGWQSWGAKAAVGARF